jgi:hypothetical protein
LVYLKKIDQSIYFGNARARQGAAAGINSSVVLRPASQNDLDDLPHRDAPQRAIG